MRTTEEQLSELGRIIDENTEVKGVSWLAQTREIMDNSSEILLVHKKTDDGEDEFSVREYPLRQSTPHKQARLSERKWNGAQPDDIVSQRARRVFPGIRLDMEKIGFEDHDVVWISKRIGRLLEKRSQEKFETTKETLKTDG